MKEKELIYALLKKIGAVEGYSEKKIEDSNAMSS